MRWRSASCCERYEEMSSPGQTSSRALAVSRWGEVPGWDATTFLSRVKIEKGMPEFFYCEELTNWVWQRLCDEDGCYNALVLVWRNGCRRWSGRHRVGCEEMVAVVLSGDLEEEMSQNSKLAKESLGTSGLRVAASSRCDGVRGGLVGSAISRSVCWKRGWGYVLGRRWWLRCRMCSAREGLEILDRKPKLVWKGVASRAVGTAVSRAGGVVGLEWDCG